MPKPNLPPLLAAAYEHLESEAQADYRRQMLRELDAISSVIASARSTGLPTIELDGLRQARASITVGADKFCPCCLRPFVSPEP
jgi:hypothetical protein